MELPPTKHRRTSDLAAVLRAVVVVAEMVMKVIWQCVKTLVPSEPQIAGKWMFIPLKMVLIGIDPYPFHPFCVVLMWTQRILKGNPGPSMGLGLPNSKVMSLLKEMSNQQKRVWCGSHQEGQ